MTHQVKGALGSKTNPVSAFSVGEYSSLQELSKSCFIPCPFPGASLKTKKTESDPDGEGDLETAITENLSIVEKHDDKSNPLYSFLSDGTPIPILRTDVSRTGRDNQRYENCPKTNNIIRLATGCVPITNDGKIIFCSSAKKKEWILPKGGWETDENIEESAARETYEESGLIGTLGPTLEPVFFKTKKEKKHRPENELKRAVSSSQDESQSKQIESAQSINSAGDSHLPPPITGNSPSSVENEVSIPSQTMVKAIFFPIYVSEVLEDWPESGRSRKILAIDEAIETVKRPELKHVLLEVKNRNLHRSDICRNQ